MFWTNSWIFRGHSWKSHFEADFLGLEAAEDVQPSLNKFSTSQRVSDIPATPTGSPGKKFFILEIFSLGVSSSKLLVISYFSQALVEIPCSNANTYNDKKFWEVFSMYCMSRHVVCMGLEYFSSVQTKEAFPLAHPSCSTARIHFTCSLYRASSKCNSNNSHKNFHVHSPFK